MVGQARLSVICVLRSGPEYRVEHVLTLADGVRRYLSIPYVFRCLTNQVEKVGSAGIEAVRLPHDWPGWWAKICLWKPGLFDGPCLYMDLDVIVTGPLDAIALGHKFTMADDFYHPGRFNSSVMAWDADLSPIYETFRRSPAGYMRKYRTRGFWGDQDFVAHHTPIRPERWQDKFPGKVVSFKKDVVPAERVPEGAAICVFHGVPRPWAISLRQRNWFEMAREAA